MKLQDSFQCIHLFKYIFISVFNSILLKCNLKKLIIKINFYGYSKLVYSLAYTSKLLLVKFSSNKKKIILHLP